MKNIAASLNARLPDKGYDTLAAAGVNQLFTENLNVKCYFHNPAVADRP
ncbi:hypothetical protein [Sodalis sp. C49]